MFLLLCNLQSSANVATLFVVIPPSINYDTVAESVLLPLQGEKDISVLLTLLLTTRR